MRVDLPRVRQLAANTKDLNDFIESFFNKCVDAGDPPYMSDLLDPTNGGQHFMIALEDRYNKDRKWPEHMKFKWRLKVNYDEWGNPPVPGESVVVERRRKHEFSPGKPLTTHDINRAMIDGTYKRDWYDRVEYPIDEKGCITVEYEDAAYLLRRWGIHGKSGAVLSMYKASENSSGEKLRRRELSGAPQKAPDGNQLHVWYWRYKEVDKEMYDALPVLTKSDKPKRGVKADA